MSIITFMLLIVALAIVLLGTAGYLTYKLVKREKPPKDFTGVATPPSFKDADDTYSLPTPVTSRESGETGGSDESASLKGSLREKQNSREQTR
jgi:hypothetical protein